MKRILHHAFWITLILLLLAFIAYAFTVPPWWAGG